MVLIYIHSLPETQRLIMSNKCPLLNSLNTWHIRFGLLEHMAEQLLEQNERAPENVKLDLYNYNLDLTHWSVQRVTITTIPIKAQIGNTFRGTAPKFFEDAHWQTGLWCRSWESFFSSPITLIYWLWFCCCVREWVFAIRSPWLWDNLPGKIRPTLMYLGKTFM